MEEKTQCCFRWDVLVTSLEILLGFLGKTWKMDSPLISNSLLILYVTYRSPREPQMFLFPQLDKHDTEMLLTIFLQW